MTKIKGMRKRYALLGEEEYLRLKKLSENGRGETNGKLLRIGPVADAKENAAALKENMDNPFIDAEQRALTHAQLMRAYLEDLEKIGARRTNVSPAGYKTPRNAPNEEKETTAANAGTDRASRIPVRVPVKTKRRYSSSPERKKRPVEGSDDDDYDDDEPLANLKKLAKKRTAVTRAKALDVQTPALDLSAKRNTRSTRARVQKGKGFGGRRTELPRWVRLR